MTLSHAAGPAPAVGPWPRVYRPGRVPEQKYVYVGERDGRLKIGIAVDVPMRMLTLKASLLAAIPGDYRTERALHHQFDHLRIEGEWYTDCEELRRWIGTLPPYGDLPTVHRSALYSRRDARK